MKVIYDKPIAKNVLNEEKLKAFPLTSGKRQGYPLSPCRWSQENLSLETLASGNFTE
jgi:hypothetical protein